MDFGTLLHRAQNNERSGKKEPVRSYSTKFQPPKKEQRNKQQLSENVKKFLAKKEAEERQKRMEANKKKEDLFALRAQDKKATRRVNVMLKRTKSANQSVIQDAVNTEHTSVTMTGSAQPDEDDYGYVSQESAAFFNKMMEKYNKMPDEPKFNLGKKKVSSNLQSTKDRVRNALEREKEEANMPHRRRRKHVEDSGATEDRFEDEPVKRKPKIMPPPSLNFNDLLKLAEKKQFEPVVIEQKPKEEERLLTKKQKKEMEREKEWRDRREGKLPPLETKPVPIKKTPSTTTTTMKIEQKKVPEKKISKPMEPPKKVPQRPNVPLMKPSSSNIPKNSTISNRRPEIRPTSSNMVKPKTEIRAREFPPRDMKQRQSGPPDRRKPFDTKDIKRKPMINKRRILDDDEEDYDSEMDDFIDDDPEEGEDYSKYINEIFGYDKAKYRYADDDVDNMESTFAQQMREETISAKIGIMEDLEDMKQEEEAKRRKNLLKRNGK